jgi:hypothetical protein
VLIDKHNAVGLKHLAVKPLSPKPAKEIASDKTFDTVSAIILEYGLLNDKIMDQTTESSDMCCQCKLLMH